MRLKAWKPKTLFIASLYVVWRMFCFWNGHVILSEICVCGANPHSACNILNILLIVHFTEAVTAEIRRFGDRRGGLCDEMVVTFDHWRCGSWPFVNDRCHQRRRCHPWRHRAFTVPKVLQIINIFVKYYGGLMLFQFTLHYIDILPSQPSLHTAMVLRCKDIERKLVPYQSGEERVKGPTWEKVRSMEERRGGTVN